MPGNSQTIIFRYNMAVTDRVESIDSTAPNV